MFTPRSRKASAATYKFVPGYYNFLVPTGQTIKIYCTESTTVAAIQVDLYNQLQKQIILGMWLDEKTIPNCSSQLALADLNIVPELKSREEIKTILESEDDSLEDIYKTNSATFASYKPVLGVTYKVTVVLPDQRKSAQFLQENLANVNPKHHRQVSTMLNFLGSYHLDSDTSKTSGSSTPSETDDKKERCRIM